MSWMETDPMNEKVKFIAAYLNNDYPTFEALCNRFNISPKTGYKFVNRFAKEGIDGLKERSRAPHYNANKMPAYIEQNILDLKHRLMKRDHTKVLVSKGQHGYTHHPTVIIQGSLILWNMIRHSARHG